MSTEEAGLASDLVDLTGINLDSLAQLSDSALVASLHRIITGNGEALDDYAAFQNKI